MRIILILRIFINVRPVSFIVIRKNHSEEALDVFPQSDYQYMSR